MKVLLSVIFAAGLISHGEGISCYQCMNLRGVTPDRIPIGMNYGTGYEAGSLSKTFRDVCLSEVGVPDTDTCMSMEMRINGSISMIVRECVTLRDLGGAGCSAGQEPFRGVLWYLI
ncbi:hypothetical protein Fcan01_11619 [Folsomia candida]|uniref:Protein sleepless n=1 Tax=Folsomia candida TaxID=158441 RepID=A0A226E717_FOLCA|nr:hypothetical protein Fcan01_11619 [Folsomia candida]